MRCPLGRTGNRSSWRIWAMHCARARTIEGGNDLACSSWSAFRWALGIGAVMDFPIGGLMRQEQSLVYQFVQDFLNVAFHVNNPLLQEPPVGDAVHGVGGVRVPRPVGENCAPDGCQ